LTGLNTAITQITSMPASPLEQRQSERNMQVELDHGAVVTYQSDHTLTTTATIMPAILVRRDAWVVVMFTSGWGRACH